MPADQAATRPTAPPPDAKLVRYHDYIDGKIESTRRMVKVVDLATALVALAVAVLSFLLLIAVAEHWVVPGGLSVAARWVFFAGLAAYLGYFAYRRIWPLCVRAVNPVYAAQAIEHGSPTLQNSLINLLMFRERRSGISDAVYRTLEEQAAKGLTRVQIDTAVDQSPLIRLGYVLIAVVAIASLYKVFSPKDPLVAAERVLMPWADIVPASRVTISDIKPGVTTISRGEFVDVTAEVRGLKDEDLVVLRYVTEDGEVSRPISMKGNADGMRYACRVGDEVGGSEAVGVTRNLAYWLEAGDARSLHYKVTVVPAATILVDRVDYDFPDYTAFVDRSVDRIGDIRAIEGTHVTVHARANGPIREAFVDFDADGRRDLTMPATGVDAKVGFVLELREDRQTPRHASYVLRFTNDEGRQNIEPVKHAISVEPDISPEAEIRLPQEKSRDVRVDEAVAIELQARDPDFALAAVRLQGETAGRAVLGEQLLAGAHRGQFSGRYVFTPAAHGLKAGDLFEYWVEADDNRAPKPNTIVTERRILRVVSPDPAQQPPPNQIAQNDRQQRPQDQRNNQQPQDGKQEGGEQGAGKQGGGDQGEKGEGQQGNEQGQQGQQGQGEGQGDGGGQQGESGGQAQAGGEGKSGAENAGQEAAGSQAGGEQQQKGDAESKGGESKEGGQRDAAGQNGEAGSAESPDGGNAKRGEQPDGAKQQPNNGQESTGSKQQSERGEGQQPGDQKQNGQQDSGDQTENAPISSDGDNDAEAFNRIQEHMEKSGDLKSEGAEGKESKSSGDKGSDQAQSEKGSQSGEGQKGAGKSADGAAGKNAKQSPNDQAANGSKGEGANEAKSQEKGNEGKGQQDGGQNKGDQQGENQTGGKQASDENQSEKEKSNGAGEQQQPGGEPTSTKGEDGAGDEQKPEGSPESKPGMKPGEKAQQSPGDQGKSDKQEPPAGSRGKRESDSQGEAGGDKTGGGEEGGGQKSPRDGTGSDGQNQSADKGGGASGEKGKGENSSEGGQDAKSDRPTGSSDGKTNGEGTEKRDGAGDKQGGSAGNTDEAKGEPSTDSQEGKEGKSGERGSPNEQPGKRDADSSKSGEAGETKPGSNKGPEEAPKEQGNEKGTDNAEGGASGGEGQPGGAVNPQPSIFGETPEGDAANLEYARKQTDLVVDKLADQLKSKKVDGELLKELGWSEAELRRFVERWQQRKTAAERNDEAGENARRELDDALRSLGLRPGELRQNAAQKDTLRDLREGYRGPVPAEYKERVRAYNQGVSRANGDRE